MQSISILQMTFNTIRQLVQFKKQRSKLHAVYQEFGTAPTAPLNLGCLALFPYTA